MWKQVRQSSFHTTPQSHPRHTINSDDDSNHLLFTSPLPSVNINAAADGANAAALPLPSPSDPDSTDTAADLTLESLGAVTNAAADSDDNMRFDTERCEGSPASVRGSALMLSELDVTSLRAQAEPMQRA